MWHPYKYGINWYEENALDGGLFDDRYMRSVLNYDDREISKVPEKYREDYLKKHNYFYSKVGKSYIRFDKITNKYYLVIIIAPSRRSTSSIITVRVDDKILTDRFEETIELPRLIDATSGAAYLVIPTQIQENNLFYDIKIEYKDSKSDEWELYGLNNRHQVYFEMEYDSIIFDKDKPLIEYGFCDYTYGGEWKRIEGIEPYKNEDGIWTSDVVKYPEKYLESHLDWYYSDERMVDYIETRGLLPQDKIDAIRAANYEDIFSFEYKMKSAIKIIPIVLVIIIIAIIVVKKIRKRLI